MDRSRKPLELDTAMERYDSKFRFVLLASARAEQLVRGAHPKLEGVSKKHTRVAMEELKEDMVRWEHGPAPAPEVAEGEAAAVAGDGTQPGEPA